MNLIVNIFCGIEIFLRVGLRYFRRGGGGGLKNYRGGVEKIIGGVEKIIRGGG